MASKLKTASLTVNFSIGTNADTDSHLSAEVDNREDGLNCGNTNFEPGDPVWWLLYKGPQIGNLSITSSMGTNTGGLKPVQDIIINDPPNDPVDSEYLTFTDEDLKATVKYPIKTGSYTGGRWIGNGPLTGQPAPTVNEETGELSLVSNAQASGNCPNKDPTDPTSRWTAIWQPYYTTEALPYLLTHSKFVDAQGNDVSKYEISIRVVGTIIP